jgi:hypothetical protein
VARTPGPHSSPVAPVLAVVLAQSSRVAVRQLLALRSLDPADPADELVCCACPLCDCAARLVQFVGTRAVLPLSSQECFSAIDALLTALTATARYELGLEVAGSPQLSVFSRVVVAKRGLTEADRRLGLRAVLPRLNALTAGVQRVWRMCKDLLSGTSAL